MSGRFWAVWRSALIGCTALTVVVGIWVTTPAAATPTRTVLTVVPDFAPADASEVTLHMYADTTFPVSVPSPAPGLPDDDGRGQASGVRVRSAGTPAPENPSPVPVLAGGGDTSPPASDPVAVSPAPDPGVSPPDPGHGPIPVAVGARYIETTSLGHWELIQDTTNGPVVIDKGCWVNTPCAQQAIATAAGLPYIVGSSHSGCQFILFLSDGTQLVNDEACLPDTPDNGDGGSVPLPGGNADIDIDHSKSRRVESDPGINGARPETPPTLVPPTTIAPAPVRGCTETARPDTYTISYPDGLVLHCDQVSS